MIKTGWVPMNDRERKKVEELVGEEQATITRTEPDEKGPLRIEIKGKSWTVNGNGSVTEED